MSRYLIIDMDKVKEPIRFWIDPITRTAKDDDGVILSEEETLEKFKECFNAGGCTGMEPEEDWEDFKERNL